MHVLRRLALAFAALTAAVAMSGCAPTVALQAAPQANDPLCAEVAVRLPDALGDERNGWQERRWTDAQATAAWGGGSGAPIREQDEDDETPPSSTAVILACGLDAPPPTSEFQCVSLEGVDWLVDDSESPLLRMTTYGRDPAVQVFVDTRQISSNVVLSTRSLVTAISMIPAEHACTDPDTLPDDAG